MAHSFAPFKLFDSLWRLLLGRGWQCVRHRLHYKEKAEDVSYGIYISEDTKCNVLRGGVGYKGFIDYSADSVPDEYLRRGHFWLLQPSELPLNEAITKDKYVQLWLRMNSPLGLEFNISTGSIAGSTLFKMNEVHEMGFSLQNQCFFPHLITAEEYPLALEGYQLMKEISLFWGLAECYGYALPAFPDDPETQYSRQFQFGSKRTNRLITFFEEDRLPNDLELAADPFAIYNDNKLAPWILEVPPGIHYLPADPHAKQKEQAILSKKADLGL